VLRVCAITAERPALLPAGPGGGALQVVSCGPLLLVVEVGAAELAPSAEALARHDAVVRALAAQVPALLPARFGWLSPDAGALATQLEPHAERLREALALTTGREQMTLRLYGPAAAGGAANAGVDPDAGSAAVAAEGDGTRYLRARRDQARRRQDVPEAAPLRAALAPLVRAERAQRHAPEPAGGEALLASVYHLVDRGGSAAYRARVQEAAGGLAPLRVAVSGPFAPYAFAPEDLA
jgi:hypothetical protein